MILLDTNVISELVRPDPDPAVIAWLDAQQSSEVASTAITMAELLYGISRLPEGRRRRRLGEAVETAIEDDLGARIEPFDASAARDYAEIVSARESAGRPIASADAQIAAICRRLRARLATRNTTDFEGTGIETVNPWQQPRA